MLGHLRDLYEFYGSEPGVRIARKHIGWYCTGRPHALAFRGSVMQATAAEQQFELVRNYFDALEASAACSCRLTLPAQRTTTRGTARHGGA